MSYEQIVTVPYDGDRQAGANSPHAVAARKDHDGDVYERLENVKEPKFGNDRRRHNEGDREERGCDWNPNARCRDPSCRITAHYCRLPPDKLWKNTGQRSDNGFFEKFFPSEYEGCHGDRLIESDLESALQCITRNARGFRQQVRDHTDKLPIRAEHHIVFGYRHTIHVSVNQLAICGCGARGAWIHDSKACVDT